MNGTYLNINLDHLKHNFNYLKSKIHPSVKILAMVKAFAYGSDAVAIAKFLEEIGVDYLAVVYVDEAIPLREEGIKTPILVLHPQPESFNNILKYQLEPNLYNFEILKAFQDFLEVQKVLNYPIHIESNSGINRLGFIFNELQKLVNIFKHTDCFLIQSVYSHFAASEDPKETHFTNSQIKAFEEFYNSLAKHLPNQPMKHICNTSGLLNYPEVHYDMVRSGIGLYGYGNHPEFDTYLRPVASLYSRISNINILNPGDSLGYNRSFIATHKTKVAVITIGYADGIIRQYGRGKGFVYVNKVACKIIGNICMDMLMIDVSKVTCKVGDAVVIFDSNYGAQKLAEAIGTISYELISTIGPRIPRKILSSI